MTATVLQTVIPRHPKHHSCLQLWHTDTTTLHLFNMYSLHSYRVPLFRISVLVTKLFAYIISFDSRDKLQGIISLI